MMADERHAAQIRRADAAGADYADVVYLMPASFVDAMPHELMIARASRQKS